MKRLLFVFVLLTALVLLAGCITPTVTPPPATLVTAVPPTATEALPPDRPPIDDIRNLNKLNNPNFDQWEKDGTATGDWGDPQDWQWACNGSCPEIGASTDPERKFRFPPNAGNFSGLGLRNVNQSVDIAFYQDRFPDDLIPGAQYVFQCQATGYSGVHDQNYPSDQPVKVTLGVSPVDVVNQDSDRILWGAQHSVQINKSADAFQDAFTAYDIFHLVSTAFVMPSAPVRVWIRYVMDFPVAQNIGYLDSCRLSAVGYPDELFP